MVLCKSEIVLCVVAAFGVTLVEILGELFLKMGVQFVLSIDLSLSALLLLLLAALKFT